jgi:hypothetical protein
MNLLGVVFMALGILSGAAWASPITYTESGQLSGTLGSTTLTNTAFTFAFSGDTTNITQPFPTEILNVAVSNSITIGASSGSFTTVVETGVNPVSGIIGFVDLTAFNGITFTSAGAVGYNLATQIFVTANTPFSASGSLGTTLGTLTITGAQNLTFTATTAVPEPASLTLIGPGLLGLTGLRLRRKRT